jgi:RNA polymerase sigma factor (sigma-70 family)
VDVAEDILQDVFSELIEAERLVQPIEQVSAWLFRVARNRITDWFRRRKPELRGSLQSEEDDSFWEDALPSPDAGPDALYERARLFDELIEAIQALPEPQRAVFVAHEIDGRSFREMAERSGESVNTLLSRKHSAVQFLRKRLQATDVELRPGAGTSRVRTFIVRPLWWRRRAPDGVARTHARLAAPESRRAGKTAGTHVPTLRWRLICSSPRC